MVSFFDSVDLKNNDIRIKPTWENIRHFAFRKKITTLQELVLVNISFSSFTPRTKNGIQEVRMDAAVYRFRSKPLEPDSGPRGRRNTLLFLLLLLTESLAVGGGWSGCWVEDGIGCPGWTAAGGSADPSIRSLA